MSLEQTTELYASVLRQLLPEGVYDTAEMTHVADDIYAHAKALAQADIDAHRLLQVLETIPVDLLADYEREYGLPMQCMVPGSQTIEERISVLRWIRQHRNVMNREYLEQILAIFGITLVDVIKHRPMLCTAPCTSPVNTERLRYKVLLRLQYPMTADMSCIIENYLPGYLRVEWVVDMPWSEWILNSEVTFTTNSTAHYTAFKTNQREYYDSYANLDLTDAVIKSLSDADMRQWQAVKDAANQLTGVTNWTIDVVNSRIKYTTPSDDPRSPEYPYYYSLDANYLVCKTPQEVCEAWNDAGLNNSWAGLYYYYESGLSYGSCKAPGYSSGWGINRYSNPNYNPNTILTEQYIPFSTLAQKILSNTLSTDQGISLLAEAYRENVAKSLFNMDPAKQFVKWSDLISQFEQNKVLRT